jgi:hypothetical protein
MTEPTVAVFPTLVGASLSRQAHTIPADLVGDVNLVFVAFLQQQQGEIDAWLARLGALESERSGLAIYEIPLLRRFPKVYRRLIDNGMRGGIPDSHARSRTITVYTDRNRFLRASRLTDEHNIWAVLVDRAGTIFWSHVGPATEAAEVDLRSTIARMLGE